MVDRSLVLENEEQDGSRYAADFDFLMHDYVLNEIKTYFSGYSCLELGGYKGDMSLKLLNHFEDVHTVEIMEELCQAIRQRSNDQVTVHNDDFATFQNYGDFDTILSCHSLEHVKHDVALLTHIASLKKPDAPLIIVVPNALSLSRRIAVNMGLLDAPEAVTKFEASIGHYRTYTLTALQNTVNAASLEMVASGGVMPKIFSNGQYDAAISAGIIDQDFLEACSNLSTDLPEICASIFLVAK
jgi:2-polyprenyl-3-methyl-5-hydroxy-6-metoxy-1,4-benzoquinol methylase